MSNIRPYLYLLLFLLILPVIMFAGHSIVETCCRQSSAFAHHESAKSIYWWKTVYDPDSLELAFLQEHNIKRVYVRYFDVIYDPANRPEPIVPNATLQFRQSFPEDMEIVPTIYITNEAMASWPEELREDESYYDWGPKPFKSTEYYVDQIIYRIKAMNIRNKVINVREIQVDCDWTRTTRPMFFHFCEELGKKLHKEGLALSSTIRLHQLKDDAPPVDRGVLMCYNTGALRNVTTKNSILHADDVYAHIKSIDFKDYGIPLDVAYPTFGWSVMYSPDKKYIGLVKTTDLSDTDYFELQEDGTYKVLKDCTSGHSILNAGNFLRLEKSEFTTISQVKSQIDLKRDLKDKEFSTILYHLDSKNLNKYSNEEIEAIYK